MPVRLRFQRLGRNKRAFYRLVAADSRSPRDGKFLEALGTYDPLAGADKVKEVRFDVDRINYWLGVGAQPSDRVAWLFAKANLLPEPPRRIRPTKSTPKAQRGFCSCAAAATLPRMIPETVAQLPAAGGDADSSFWGTLLELQPRLFASAIAAHGNIATAPSKSDGVMLQHIG